jgi:hypothetical protein
MKGIETALLLGIISVIAILVIIYLVVVGPAMGYAQGAGNDATFREFCLHWSIVGYPTDGYPNKDGNLIVGKYSYSITSYCSSAGTPDLPSCVRNCKAAA